jgi:RNA polymerase sigma-70 factor, ECF subfamily
MKLLRNLGKTLDPIEWQSVTPPKLGEVTEKSIAAEMRRVRALQTNELLFERIALERSAEAFSEFYDRFAPRIYSLLLHMLRSEEDAQDLLQEIFLTIWRNAPSYLDTKGDIASWVFTLARNRVIDEFRSKRYRNRALETQLSLEQERPTLNEMLIDRKLPDSDLHAADLREDLRYALAMLSPDEQRIIDLSYFGGIPLDTIAVKMGMPPGTIRTRRRRGILKLAEYLRPRH